MEDQNEKKNTTSIQTNSNDDRGLEQWNKIADTFFDSVKGIDYSHIMMVLQLLKSEAEKRCIA